MAQRTKYSREIILASALGITECKGLSAVTARSISKDIGCSVKPIFTAFDNMDELLAATVKEAKKLFIAYMEQPYPPPIDFLKLGLRWIEFAREKPNLYQTLFIPSELNTHALTLKNLSENFSALNDKVIPIIENNFDLSFEDAVKLYNQMILHAHGIACLIVADETEFSEENVKEILRDTVSGLVMFYKKSENL